MVDIHSILGLENIEDFVLFSFLNIQIGKSLSLFGPIFLFWIIPILQAKEVQG